MALPKNFDCEKDGPKRIACHHCHYDKIAVTNMWRLTGTGIVEQLYVCTKCSWCYIIAYDAMLPHQYIRIDCWSPDAKGKPRLKLKGAISSGRFREIMKEQETDADRLDSEFRRIGESLGLPDRKP